ncbi:MAG TPA: UDP-N-acetylmuramoyl-tripeptide--D-alanyl-D-alanine ligase [Draconibacterium sp.]|nr:UDP-N-acetylmuramoyl-tripeptide--D-alanyl-D-alanine ligase [Draconibacterium sp.]
MINTEYIYQLFKRSPEITTDSRNIKPGCLFFALKGENFNGNKFAKDALNKGAIFAIIDEKQYHIPEKTILVKDTLKSLQKLANLHRKKLGIPILSITGTNGKTTTKELVSNVLAQKFNVSFTQGNLNNHIGVPLTLLSMNSETEFGVVEMGANHPGEIAALCSIADPDFGLITNVGKAHLEGFGSFEGVKRTKAELYNFIKEKRGTIFLNTDNQNLKEMASGIQNKITYGKQNADFTGEPVISPPFVHVKANFPKGVLYLNTNLIGDFNFENVLAAACLGNYFGVDPLKIQSAIKAYQPHNIRSQLIQKNDLKIIMDAYNANPTSMQASIKSFLSVMPKNNYLILGDMLELGEYTAEEHTNILNLLKKYAVKGVFLVGNVFTEVAKNSEFQTFVNVDQLCNYLENHKIEKGNILIKGSRGIRLEKVLNYI